MLDITRSANQWNTKHLYSFPSRIRQPLGIAAEKATIHTYLLVGFPGKSRVLDGTSDQSIFSWTCFNKPTHSMLGSEKDTQSSSDFVAEEVDRDPTLFL